MEDNTCDNCGKEAELFYNEVTGLSFCEDCDTEYVQEANRFPDFESDTDEVEAPLHAEIRALIENDRSPVTATHLPPGMVEQAEALLALPEESVAALVEAARLMVGAAQYGR